MSFTFNCIREERPVEKWKALFERTWPSYKDWFLTDGHHGRKGYITSTEELTKHMPELMPLYHELVALAGGGDLEARFLSMYTPPTYMSGCSQVAWTRNSPTLIRNYDYSFKVFEGVMFYSNWLQPVIGMSDSTWGLLDGMNASGLAASLTFGGRKVTGDGFGILIIIRYVLETATTVDEGVAILSRIPVHMAYNVTLLDAAGKFATVYLAPDEKPIVVQSPVVTNHQETIDWEEYANLTATVERKKYLEEMLHSPYETEASMVYRFLHPPLYNTNFEKSFGTLYTGVYRIGLREVSILWPDLEIKQSFEHFTEFKLPRELFTFSKGLLY